MRRLFENNPIHLTIRWLRMIIYNAYNEDEINEDINLCLKNLETKIPKALVKVYNINKGNKICEVGSLVYGYFL